MASSSFLPFSQVFSLISNLFVYRFVFFDLSSCSKWNWSFLLRDIRLVSRGYIGFSLLPKIKRFGFILLADGQSLTLLIQSNCLLPTNGLNLIFNLFTLTKHIFCFHSVFDDCLLLLIFCAHLLYLSLRLNTLHDNIITHTSISRRYFFYWMFWILLRVI